MVGEGRRGHSRLEPQLLRGEKRRSCYTLYKMKASRGAQMASLICFYKKMPLNESKERSVGALDLNVDAFRIVLPHA